jgi:hypothetical protein
VIKNLPDIYVGAILTFVTLVIIEYIKNIFAKNDQRKNYVLYLKIELSSASKFLEKIKDGIQTRSTFDFTYIGEIERSINNLEQSRRDTILLTPENQTIFYDLLNELRRLMNECRFIQELYSDHNNLFNKKNTSNWFQQIFPDAKENQTYFDQKKTEKIVEIIDLKRRTEELIKLISP